MNEKTQIFNVIYKSIYNEEISENTFYGKEGNWATFNWIDLNELDNIPVHPKEIKEIALEKINHVVNEIKWLILLKKPLCKYPQTRLVDCWL